MTDMVIEHERDERWAWPKGYEDKEYGIFADGVTRGREPMPGGTWHGILTARALVDGKEMAVEKHYWLEPADTDEHPHAIPAARVQEGQIVSRAGAATTPHPDNPERGGKPRPAGLDSPNRVHAVDHTPASTTITVVDALGDRHLIELDPGAKVVVHDPDRFDEDWRRLDAKLRARVKT
jgi:hypothetical protein